MGALIFFKSGRYIEYFDTTCKRSQTDPGLPVFGSRSAQKNETGFVANILNYYFSIQYYHFSLSEEKVVRGEKPPGHA